MAQAPMQQPVARPVQGAAPAPRVGAQSAQAQGGNIPPQAQQDIRKIVMAGMKALYAQNVTSSIVEILKSEAQNPPEALADATTKIMIALYEKSGGKMPKAFIIPAGQALLRPVADLAAKIGIFEIDKNIAMQASQLLVKKIAEAFGGTQQQSAAAQPPGGGMVGRAMQAQPAQMQAV